ncbi:hypothetical protein BaRGS_00031507 [Batillaria attramentaria]|uniref:EF-hand domain-containing protein n=1 Tax=Batillaria attramentaria TaxID=370345 RepID=A0ABD0JQP6_9CAEN
MILYLCGQAIRRAGRWVRDNCNVGLGGVSCRGIKILRRRRSADVTTEHPVTAMLDKVCPKFDVGPNAKMEEVVDAAMMEMDDNKDGTLNTNESVRFTELMGVLDYCSEQRKYNYYFVSVQVYWTIVPNKGMSEPTAPNFPLFYSHVTTL